MGLQEKLFLGPILKEQDFLMLITWNYSLGHHVWLEINSKPKIIQLFNYFAVVGGEILRSSCLYVCLSVCPLPYLKTACPNFTKFSIHVTPGCGLVLLWWQCNKLCISGLWLTSCCHIMGPMGRNQARHCFVQFARQVAVPVGRQTTWRLVEIATRRHEGAKSAPC